VQNRMGIDGGNGGNIGRGGRANRRLCHARMVSNGHAKRKLGKKKSPGREAGAPGSVSEPVSYSRLPSSESRNWNMLMKFRYSDSAPFTESFAASSGPSSE